MPYHPSFVPDKTTSSETYHPSFIPDEQKKPATSEEFAPKSKGFLESLTPIRTIHDTAGRVSNSLVGFAEALLGGTGDIAPDFEDRTKEKLPLSKMDAVRNAAGLVGLDIPRSMNPNEVERAIGNSIVGAGLGASAVHKALELRRPNIDVPVKPPEIPVPHETPQEDFSLTNTPEVYDPIAEHNKLIDEETERRHSLIGKPENVPDNPEAQRLEAERNALETKPTATFKGWREGAPPDIPDFPLYDIEGGPSHGSTVDAAHLQKLGIDIPETPENPNSSTGEYHPSFVPDETPKTEETALSKTNQLTKELPQLSRLVDEGGTIQLGFHEPVTEDQIRGIFPDQELSISKVKGSPLFDSVRKNNEFYKVSFWKNNALDYKASKAATESLGGHLYEARPVGATKTETTPKPSFVNPFEKPQLPEAQVEVPKFTGLQNHGDGVLYAQFDRKNPITEDEIKSMFPEHDIKVTEFHVDTIPGGTQRFRIDTTPESANAIEKSVGGSFDDVKELAAGVPPPKNTKPFKGPAGAAVDKLMDALSSAHDLATEQSQKLRIERAKRFAAFEGVKSEGAAGAAKSMGKLKGEYSKIELDNPLQLSKKHVNDLFTTIKRANITTGEKARGYSALKTLLEGGNVPARSDLKVLDDVFGGGFSDKITELHGGLGAIGLSLTKAANTMKAMRSTLDVSAPLRQGIGLVHRAEYRNALGEMFKYFANENYYNESMKALESRPTYMLGREAGLFLAKPDSLLQGEEAFMNNYISNIPGLRQLIAPSERAYTGFLNKLRADTFDNLIKNAKASGSEAFTIAEHTDEDGNVHKSLVPTKVTEDLAKFVNVATGRGKLGMLEKVAPELNAVIWSPRLISSRLTALNPKYYMDLSPIARQEALKSLFAIATAGSIMSGLAYLGGAKVKHDIFHGDLLSADVGKARFPSNNVLDPWGGFQQPIVAASRFLMGKTDTKPQSRAATAGNYLVSKLSPAASLAYDIASATKFTGKTQGGNFSINPSKFQFPEAGGYNDRYNQPRFVSADIRNSFVPLFAQDVATLFNSHPDLREQFGLDAAGALGAGIQNYPEAKPKNSLNFRKMRSLTP